MERNFSRGEKQYTNEEKLQLAELVSKFKDEYDAEVKRNEGKTRYDAKRKRHVPIMPAQGFVAKAVRYFYSDLANVKHDDPELRKALKLASRSFNDIENLRDPSTSAAKKKRAAGAGRKSKSPEVRQALFSWFVDVRESLKGRLPRRLFKLKANQLYENWLINNPTPEEDRLKFGNQLIKEWEAEYGISLRMPNKRFSISKEDLVERLEDYLKNM